MQSFYEHAAAFEQRFNKDHFPTQPENLYKAAQYLLSAGGKRIRPAVLLMANELFTPVTEQAFHVASAVEMFHNFSLVHDDIMDNAPLRRGRATVHEIYGANTAILAGDVMFATCYSFLGKVKPEIISAVLRIFNKTAIEVCEGQQMDMDFESRDDVSLDEYINMIALKTSVLLGASLQLGALLGGAGLGNQEHLYNFGKNLGIAFQVQDDYLDAFGNPEKFGKMVGGDIIANKKTFLQIHAYAVANVPQRMALEELATQNTPAKVSKVLDIYRDCGVVEWAKNLKEKYYQLALQNLEDVAVISSRKTELRNLAEYLLERES